MSFFGFLLLALLVLNTTLRFFTNYLNVVPRLFNIADVFMVGLFLLLFLGHKGATTLHRKEFDRLVIFNLILVSGALLNLEYLHAQATASQLIMWNEPIILFLVLINLPFSLRDVRAFNRLLFALIIFEFLVGITQVPIYLETGQSESIIGSFHGNAEQYGAFVMIGVFYLMGKWRVEPARRVYHGITLLGMLALILLIDNKASWIGIALSILYLLHRMGGLDAHPTSKIKYVFAFSLLSLFGLFVIGNSSSSLYKYATIQQAWQSGNFFNLGKFKAYRDVFTAYTHNPYMALVGSGPATFYSRASSQFYGLSEDMFINPLARLADGKNAYRVSDSMGGVIEKTEAEPFFKTFFLESKIYTVGSGTADDPFFSFVALLGETGILGTLVYLGIYVMVFKKLSFCFDRFRKDAALFPLTASTLGFLVYLMIISIYNNWLETGRMTTILWSMITMVLKYHELTPAHAIEDDSLHLSPAAVVL